MPVSLPPGVLTPRPRRLVDRRGGQTTITRKSAQARIPGLTQGLTVSSDLTPTSNLVHASVLSNDQTTRRQSTATLLQTRRTLDFAESLSGHDDSDSDGSYNSFITTLRKKDALRLDSKLRVDELLDRTLSERSANPSPALTASYQTRATTHCIISSFYRGHHPQTGKLTAQLSVAPLRKPGERDHVKPLFKWLHIENPNMHFGAYMEYVNKCPFLNDRQRASVSRILRNAREKSERSLRRPFSFKGSYIEAEYLEEALEYIDHRGPRSQRSKKEIVRWIAVPFFYLTSSATLSQEVPKNFRFNVPFGTSGSIVEGTFFQVAQLWCLIIGEHLMISCSRAPLTQVPHTLIKFSYTSALENRKISLRVSDGGNRLWLLPIEDCATWFSFISHFVGLGFKTFEGWQVKYRNIVLAPTDWNLVIAAAKRTTIHLTISKRDNTWNEAHPQLSSDEDTKVQSPEEQTKSPSEHRGKLIPHVEQSPTPSPTAEFSDSEALLLPYDGSSAEPALQVNDIHVFTLLATLPKGSVDVQSLVPSHESTAGYRIDEQQLSLDLSELDHYLSGNNRPTESLKYSECPTKTFSEVQRSCSASGGDHFEKRKIILKAARSFFVLFFPLHYQHAVTLKFWGSIDRFIHAQNHELEHVAEEVVHIGRLAKEIQGEISSGNEASEFSATIPQEFFQAWIHIQQYFIGFPADNPHQLAIHLHRCKDRLWQGRLKLVERSQAANIRDREAVLPLGAILLLLNHLLHDSQDLALTEGQILTSNYWSFFKAFKAEVYGNPLMRNYEKTFATLKDEFETIISTLEDQQRVLVALQDSISEAENLSFVYKKSASRRIGVEPTREASVVEHLWNETEEMLQNFREMARHLSDLESHHFLCLSIDNDMQQKASFAFTTVTVFFLPLTTLAGIFGMNTSDIRNLSESQWLFWCIAIPLAVICLSTWLIYLGTLTKTWPWGKRRNTLQKNRAA